MSKVIKTGEEWKDRIKYLIIDQEKHLCRFIPENDYSKEKIAGIISVIKQKFKDYDVASLPPLSPEEEVFFLWPQLMEEIKRHTSYANGWLETANLKYDQESLTIMTESSVAYKMLSNEGFLRFLGNRLYYYLNKQIDVKITQVLKQISNTKTEQKISDNVITDNRLNNQITHSLAGIDKEENDVVVEGQIFNLDSFRTRNGNTLFTIDITDNTNSITVKYFSDDENYFKDKLKEKDWVRVRGNSQFDKYSNGIILMASELNYIERAEREDNVPEKRCELHLHTQMSALDSVVDIDQAVEKAAHWGHPAIAITDHGVVQAFPDAYKAGKKYGIKIIYGMEAYLADDGEPIIINAGNESLDKATFTVFDLETTGLKSINDHIIEIGAVKIKDGKIVDEYSTLINPGEKIPPEITRITGITDDMVINSPLLEEVIDDFLSFIDDSVLTAHNARFDYGFLRSALYRTGKPVVQYPLLDTVGLSRALFPELKNHKLNTVCDFLDINLEHHHRAVDDARATAQILLKSSDLLGQQGISLLKDINSLTEKIDWKNLPLYHLVILARNQNGLKDLYRLVSSSHLQHFYRKPRILKSELVYRRDNLLFGSACNNGQLFRSIIDNKSNREIEKIARFYDFLEIQPVNNQNKEINRRIYQLGKKLNKPVVATGNVHFLDPEDAIYRTILQTGQGYEKTENQTPLYFRTTEEMLEEFSYLGKEKTKEVVIDNPLKIVKMIDDLKPIPDGLFTPEIEGADKQLREMSYQKAYELYGKDLPQPVEMRLERELNSIIDNGFSVIYLIAQKLVQKSLDDGYLVGSRGSVGSSLIARVCGITEVNPLPPHYRCPECKNTEFISDSVVEVGIDLPDRKCPQCGSNYIKDGYDIPFEVFMGFKGDKVPDIDLNFSGEYQSNIHQYTEELFGRDFVFRAGTISTIARQTAFGFVKGYIESNNLKLNNAELNRLVKGCTGVRRTTGQHPGGLMIIPQHLDVHDFTPIQHPANDQKTGIRTTHFDYHSISGRILKLDLLGHDDPTSLKNLQDLTGVSPLDIPLDDPETMALFSSTKSLNVSPEEIGTPIGTLGIPEFGTSFVRQMLLDTKPTTFSELVRISGLSHGTDVWLNNAQDLIKSGKIKLSEVISARDDIMNFLIEKGLEPVKAFQIMEHVRKGKGLTGENEEYMKEKNIPDWYIDSCKKIKYMFPKAHASAYVMMAFRIAYFKVHYPEAFYATYFSRNAGDFDANLINKGYKEIINKKKELEEKGNKLSVKEKGILSNLELVLEAMARGIKFTIVDLYSSDTFMFKITDQGLLPPLISLEGLGNSAAASIAATREEGVFASIEDLINRTRISKTVIENMQQQGTLDGLPKSNQLSLF